ncbi:hypothetical protein PV10_06429 [Exophiala mesophila]|uniref:Peroxisomal membrane protein PEX17 n=1 Tax=Exophiala mesophila TaxID=212818 RepID=A0A0D1ZB77_EXOME|nr:uncharacterized protein PV10_06429 [Exophiala mesophila]KIV91942.1 hypothetical protein PV10_06429 [Exophiala mesophila]
MDRSLATLLRSLQTSEHPEEAFRLLPVATNLLSKLSNPLNVTLLASQVLSNDALYPRPVELSASRRVFSLFYTAVLRLIEDKQNPPQTALNPAVPPSHSDLSISQWVKAVVKGADDTSPRWRHSLMIGALLLAFHSRQFEDLSWDLRQKLEAALVISSNLALQQKDTEANSEFVIVFVLNHTFPVLSETHQSQIQYNFLLPTLVDTALFSHEGLEHGYWLASVDRDVRQSSENTFNWSAASPSFKKITEIKSRPLVTGLGALSRLLAHAIDHVHDRNLIIYTTNRIAEFSKNVVTSWRQNKLSEIEPGEEVQFLDQETLGKTLPSLLQMLRDTMFAAVIALRSVLGRLLCDNLLASNNNAPALAMQSLHILRDTYFIAHRFGLTSSSQYTFVNFTAIDILSQYQAQSVHFLEATRPVEIGEIPAHPLDRLLDLFFLNTAEHFTLAIPPRINQGLLFNAAAPYVNPQDDSRLGEIYEAAHSVMLAIFAAPQNTEVATRNVPFYVQTLLQSFPRPLNSRQFRLAIKSIVRIAAPPSSVALAMPLMQAIILDLLRERVEHASEEFLPPDPNIPVEETQPLSEKAVLLLCIIDCLSFLPIPLLEEWLPLTADLLHRIQSPGPKQQCQQRLWEALSNGEMDVDRAAVCVTWWTSRGGREHVLLGSLPEEQEYAMSGAIAVDSKL